jgi:hypothetical protein
VRQLLARCFPIYFNVNPLFARNIFKDTVLRKIVHVEPILTVAHEITVNKR